MSTVLERPASPPEFGIGEQQQVETAERLLLWFTSNTDYVVARMSDDEALIVHEDDKRILRALASGDAIEAYRIFDSVRSGWIDEQVRYCIETWSFPREFDQE